MMTHGAKCPVHGLWLAGGNFCPQCGVPMEPAHNECPKCAHTIEPFNARFCRNCGIEVAPPSEPKATQRCPECRRAFHVMADEQGMHTCPWCGYEPGTPREEEDA